VALAVSSPFLDIASPFNDDGVDSNCRYSENLDITSTISYPYPISKTWFLGPGHSLMALPVQMRALLGHWSTGVLECWKK
jgi:hypothetical protein